MQRLRVDPVSPDPIVLQQAVTLLKSGAVIAFPTDTLYGLAADAHNPGAVEVVFSVKGRAHESALPLIAADRSQVEAQVGRLSPRARRLAEAFWPGPLTLIVDAWPSIAAAVHRGRGRVAVRVPNHEVARALARLASVPLTATSANPHGHAAAITADEVMAHLPLVSLVVDAGPTPGGAPSTIIDVVGDDVRLVRAGAVPWERVLEFL
ncbi:MAG: threonylcarbamoyl-AMP synthase [Acidobacteria bacterium]|nr:threonylcarbamoyl-AMP synthase [Acidobacteriota bacterium]MBI3261977.1 threonylcarbamoyl-AMP synthase [Acidobacteriota bacterium]